jgi:hypothetical protein
MIFRFGKSSKTCDASSPATVKVSSWMKCSEYVSRAGGRQPAEWISAGTSSSHSASQTGYQKRSPIAGGCALPSYGSGLSSVPTKPSSSTQRRSSATHRSGFRSMLCGRPATPRNRSGSSRQVRAMTSLVSCTNHSTSRPCSLCIIWYGRGEISCTSTPASSRWAMCDLPPKLLLGAVSAVRRVSSVTPALPRPCAPRWASSPALYA